MEVGAEAAWKDGTVVEVAWKNETGTAAWKEGTGIEVELKDGSPGHPGLPGKDGLQTHKKTDSLPRQVVLPPPSAG